MTHLAEAHCLFCDWNVKKNFKKWLGNCISYMEVCTRKFLWSLDIGYYVNPIVTRHFKRF